MEETFSKSIFSWIIVEFFSPKFKNKNPCKNVFSLVYRFAVLFISNFIARLNLGKIFLSRFIEICFMYKPLQQVDKLTYLCSNISSSESDGHICLGKTRIATNKLTAIWKSDL